MKKIFVLTAIIGLLLITGCGNTESKDDKSKKEDFLHLEDIDKDKTKKAIIKSALETNMLSRQDYDYKEEDIVNIKVCEAVHTDEIGAEFDGKFITYWETTDGGYSHYALMENYKVDNTPHYEIIDDRCMELN